jgi:hypothetical protein
MRSVAVVGEGPTGAVVVPDRGGQCQDAGDHSDDDSCRGAPAVAFQVESALEGLVDRLDDLRRYRPMCTTDAVAALRRTRECDAQWPYSAQPASAERRATSPTARTPRG